MSHRPATVLAALVAFIVLCANCMFVTSPQKADADGLTTENLPPVLVRGKQLSLFIRINPPILTTQTMDDASLQLRLFEVSNNQTIQHVSYLVIASKQDDPTPLLRELFHSHSGLLTLNLEPRPGDVMVSGAIDPISGGWSGPGDQLTILGPLLLDSGLHYFNIKILGIDDDSVAFEPENAPVFEGWLSVGDSFETKLIVDHQEFNTTVISYYERVQDFSFDSEDRRISWSTPFDWNLERIANQNIFVHQEIRVPKSLIQYLNSSSFTATVNDIPVTGSAVAVDPYTSEKEYVVHYLINKPTIMQLAEIRAAEHDNAYEKAMLFALTINSQEMSSLETSGELVTDSGALKISLSWSPSKLLPNAESLLIIRFYDAFERMEGEYDFEGDTRYDLKIVNKTGNVVFTKENLVAKNGTDSHLIIFPTEDAFNLQVNVTGTRNGDTKEWDQGIRRVMAWPLV